jgi:hypothetical protein
MYVDVYNVEQPMVGDITANQKITLTIDADDDYTNGAGAFGEVNDNFNGLQPIASSAAKISILDSSVDSSLIRSTQTVTLSMDMGVSTVFSSGRELYFELPASYSEWIMRSDTIDHATNDCYFEETGSGTNLANLCKFISKRILKITVIPHTPSSSLYKLIIKNLKSPSFLPTGKDNQYRFQVFCSSTSAETDISHYSFIDLSNELTLTTDETLLDLSWKSYDITQLN